MSIRDKSLLDILRKKAEGYKISEISEEFAIIEGEQVLTKRKVAEKHIAPDLSALKLLLELTLTDSEELTAEQMEAEKARLLQLLRTPEPESSDNNQQSQTNDTICNR